MKTIRFLIACSCIAVIAAGCASMPKPDFSKFKPAGQAQSVMAVWEPAVNNNGEKSERGFGGRVYFYDQDKTRPVKVHGTVVVYAFDEEGRTAGDTKPSEGYVFEDKVLNSRSVYKSSKLGPSYNLWVPIDSAGPDGNAKKVSLIVRYMPKKGGGSIVSQQATAYLPGKNSPAAMVAKVQHESSPTDAIQQVTLNTRIDTRIDSNGVVPIADRVDASSVGASLIDANNVDESKSLTQEKIIESNPNRPQTMQTSVIR